MTIIIVYVRGLLDAFSRLLIFISDATILKAFKICRRNTYKQKFYCERKPRVRIEANHALFDALKEKYSSIRRKKATCEVCLR